MNVISKLTFNSSSNSSSNSSTCVKDILSKWGHNTVGSCTLGISNIGFSSKLSHNISHAALLLLDKQIDYDQEDKLKKEMGILIEYGDYSPDMDSKEKKFVDKGYVVYHYGSKGGLRYYGKNYSEFIKEFGDIGYIDFNIHADNQKSFKYFLENIANLNENKWIKEKYSVGLINNFNCQTFAAEALKVLKPYYTFQNITARAADLVNAKSANKKVGFVPDDIRKTMTNYYKTI